MTFSNKIKKLRKDNKMTQENLADKLNVSRQTISKWENGVTFPDIDNILEICRVFNVSSDSLLNYQSEIEVRKITKINWIYPLILMISLLIIIILLFSNKLDETSSIITINVYGFLGIVLIGLCVFSIKFIFKNKRWKKKQ